MLACSYRVRQFIFILFVILLAGCASSQLKTPSDDNQISAKPDRRNSLIAPELLHLDLEQLVSKIIEVHPEPFTLISEQEFRASAEVIRHSIRYPLSRSEFYLRVAPLVNRIGDVHTSVELPKYLPQALAINERSVTESNSALKLFPLAVLFETDAVYIAADLSDKPKIPTGAVLTSVNGAPIDYLLTSMKELIVKETESGQRRKIQVDFPWLLVAMGKARNRYDIGYSWRGQSFNEAVEGIMPANKASIEESESNINQTASHQSFYGFSQLTDKTSLLWFNDFKESPEKFNQFLEQQFASIRSKGIKNIIIDVRYNEGGLSQNIKSLLSYIITEPIYWNQIGELNISSPLKKLHKEETKQRRKVKYQWGLQWLPLEWTDLLLHQVSWGDEGEKIRIEFDEVEAHRNDNSFKITLLINGYCYSACSSFVGAVKYYQLGEVIGEMAGNFIDVQYGYPLKSSLEHSRLKLALPTMKLVFNGNQTERKQVVSGKNELVSPDIEITRSLQQVIERQDLILDTAIVRIESKKE